MKIAAQKLNKGITLSKQALQNKMESATKKYYRCCEELYNLGFNYAMYDFDEPKFIKALKQEFPDEFLLFKDFNSGKMDFSLERVEYILAGSLDNEDFKIVLKLYKDILQSLESFRCINILWTKAKFKKNSDIKVILPRYVITSKVNTAGVLPFYDTDMLDSIALSPTEKVVHCKITDVLYKFLLKEAGISDSDIESYSSKNKGLVNKDLSFCEECNFIYMILENRIDFNGEFGDKVRKYIENYYISFYKDNTTKTSIVPFSEYLFTEALPECIKKVNKFREDNPNHQEIFITNKCVYFKVESNAEMLDFADDFVGTCVLDAEAKDELDKTNNLLGYSGEYISEATLKSNGWVCDMPPVRLYRKGQLYNYYPSFLVKVDDDINYEPILGYGTTYNHASSMSAKSVEGGFKFSKAKDDINQLYYLIAKHFGMNSVETILLTTLCCVELDMTRDKMSSPNSLGSSFLEFNEKYVSSCKKVSDVFALIKFKP